MTETGKSDACRASVHVHCDQYTTLEAGLPIRKLTTGYRPSPGRARMGGYTAGRVKAQQKRPSLQGDLWNPASQGSL
jgi:hypothetical protein